MEMPDVNGDPLTILLVEDNPAHAELVRRSLENHRVANRLNHVPDGEQAMDYLEHRGAYADPVSSPIPQVVLLDLRLPRMDGLEVLSRMKASQTLRQIPVVIVSTSDAEQDVARAYQTHANSYVVKPVDFQKFSSLMDDLGFYWLAWNHHPW